MSERVKKRRPALPADLFKPEPALVGLCFLYAFASFFGFGYLSYLVTVAPWPLLAKVPALVICGLLSSNGLHLLGWLAHEGIHLSIVKNKDANLLIGAFAGAVLMFPTIGLGIAHWPHHRFTNLDRDPDTALQSRQQTLWRRILLARPAANRQYMSNAIGILLGRPRDSAYRLPFSERKLRWYSGIGFAFMALWMAGYVAVGWSNPTYAIVAFLLPYLWLIPTTGVRIYIEHAGTQAGEFVDARSYTSAFYTVLLFGNNYHLEHHLYPSVPSYKLPRVHRKLRAEGYYDIDHVPIVSGVLAPLRFAASHYAYPEGGARSDAAPPPILCAQKNR